MGGGGAWKGRSWDEEWVCGLGWESGDVMGGEGGWGGGRVGFFFARGGDGGCVVVFGRRGG